MQKYTETAYQIDSPSPDLLMVRSLRSISGLETHSIQAAKTAGPRPRSARSSRDPSGSGKGLPWRPDSASTTEVLTLVSGFTAPAPGPVAGSQGARRPPPHPTSSSPLVRYRQQRIDTIQSGWSGESDSGSTSRTLPKEARSTGDAVDLAAGLEADSYGVLVLPKWLNDSGLPREDQRPGGQFVGGGVSNAGISHFLVGELSGWTPEIIREMEAEPLRLLDAAQEAKDLTNYVAAEVKEPVLTAPCTSDASILSSMRLKKPATTRTSEAVHPNRQRS